MSSAEQVRIEETRFLEWARAFGVYKNVAEDELELTDEIRPFVWTEFYNDDESLIDIGFTESNSDLRMPVVGYYISRIPCPAEGGEYELVLSSALIDCSDCEALGEDANGDDCPTCSGERGEFVEFELPGN